MEVQQSLTSGEGALHGHRVGHFHHNLPDLLSDILTAAGWGEGWGGVGHDAWSQAAGLTALGGIL